MDIVTLIHQGVLYLHVVAFSIAFSAVLREDLALFHARRVDLQRLRQTAHTLTITLAVLWASGLALLAIDAGLDMSGLGASPKAQAKLLVAAALTANGLALHAWAFPMLQASDGRDPLNATLPVVLGVTSTVSWSYAAFLGVARVIAPSMSLTSYLAWYAASLLVAITCALLFVRPHVARWLAAER
jgi:hypothetical protein